MQRYLRRDPSLLSLIGEESTHDVHIPCELVAADVVAGPGDMRDLEVRHECLERRGTLIGDDRAALGVAGDQQRRDR